ncbi:class I SAM-dependent DNA methyltransferase [Saccharothrix luteola]|uniref:class I SAM-dependent DNA methyltransferase n=1 Tax=Saccharothrix luteola TaxID=2893018 RepID=UPI001E4992D3|nr:class I SAM-dependent methyltransferase [Saccharothrix luteola]MCC8245802.1 class I SAM-dependent methyltransferase [Saccharothrix luteola]
MSSYDVIGDPAFFGKVWAEDYDDGTELDPTPAVDFLAPMAGGRRTLELAIGTGRVALPLAARGVPVEGVEGSELMAAKLAAKPGGANVPVTIGDMADVPVTGRFALVYLVFNTIFNLVDARRQADCFANVARVLEPDGAFVIETYVPDPSQFPGGKRVQALWADVESAAIEVYDVDLAAQRFVSQKIIFTADGIRLKPHAQRYTYPGELDLMAERAGLHLTERHESWTRRPFTGASKGHISVYRPM